MNGGLTTLRTPARGRPVKRWTVVALLLILLLLALLFGGLGVFVAKVFLFGLLVVLILAVIGGMRIGRSGRRV